jgi:rubrerythrin
VNIAKRKATVIRLRLRTKTKRVYTLPMPATKTCDACGMRFEFTSHKDRCPVCCPKDEPEEDDYDYDQSVDDDD